MYFGLEGGVREEVGGGEGKLSVPGIRHGVQSLKANRRISCLAK